MPFSRRTPKSRQSSRFIERRQTRAIVIACLVAVSLTAWLLVLSRLSSLPFLTIADIRVNGADPDIAPALQAAALEALDGSYLGLFSKANSWLYPRKALVAAVESSSPRIQSVRVASDGGTGLTVTVDEKAPAALVCAGFPDWSGQAAPFVGDACYFADADGYIFASAPSFSGQVYDRLYMPDLPLDASSTAGSAIGVHATSSDEFRSVLAMYDGTVHAGIGVEALLVKGGGEYEMYARNPDLAPSSGASSAADADVAVIYVDNASPFADQLSNLISFWNKMSTDARAARSPLRFDYIDVRYSPNVFYRLTT